MVRLEQASSFVSAQLCEFTIANPSCGDETPALPSTLPGFSPVFLLCEFSCAPENFFIGLELTAISRQSLRKFLGEVSLHSEALNAALLQQTAMRTSLCRPGDLAAIHHHVGVNRIREAFIARKSGGLQLELGWLQVRALRPDCGQPARCTKRDEFFRK